MEACSGQLVRAEHLTGGCCHITQVGVYLQRTSSWVLAGSLPIFASKLLHLLNNGGVEALAFSISSAFNLHPIPHGITDGTENSKVYLVLCL